MGKIFEVLAVEEALGKRLQTIFQDTLAVLKNKEHLFLGNTRSLSMFDTSPEKAVEIKALEDKESISVDVSTTVPEHLNYFATNFAALADVLYQRDVSNQRSNADVVVNGQMLLKDAPATFLLALENKLTMFRDVVKEIPTLNPQYVWTPDNTYRRKFVYRSNEVTTVKTEKGFAYNVMSPATDKFPAQVHTVETAKNIGRYTEVKFSGMISSATKAELLDRTDALIRAIKQARQRANANEAINDKVADKLMMYILGDWYNPGKANPDAKV